MSVVVENGTFQRFRWRFSYTLDMRSALSYGDMQSVVAFPVTQPLLLENGGGGTPGPACLEPPIVSRDSPDMTHKIFRKGGGHGHVTPKFLGVKC